MSKRFFLASMLLVALPTNLVAQDVVPTDNGLTTYHTAPRYRESESHPLRIVAYVLHPIGWLAREVVFRPLSYFASSTEVTRSVMGYREPYDYRQPECFSADDSSPDCRSILPYNYDNGPAGSASVSAGADSAGEGSAGVAGETASLNATSSAVERQVYFPDVNYDFNVRQLSDLGRGRARQIAQMLSKEPGLKVVLQGHADYRGTEPYNEKLGMDRSEALKQELVALGVPAEKVSTVTFGESQPVFTEQEDWARAVNRRVEVHVSESAVQ